MPDKVLEKMISTFMATGQEQYAFGWQGGEPTLMGVDFFKKVTALQEKYGTGGAQVSNGLQTNTTLIDDAFAEHLAKYNFLVGVSIDGPPEIHNRYRKYGDGRGAHADVMKGLELLKKHGVEYNVLTLVSQSNVREPALVYNYLKNMGVFFHQYIECVEFDKCGNLMPFAVNGKEWGAFLCGIYDEWIKEDTRKVSVRLFDSIVSMMVDGIANVCAMSNDCRQYLVVEFNGDVYPCDFFVQPDMKLGNIMQNSWEEMLDSRAYREFGERKARWNKECEKCEYLRYCAGCCPKNRPMKGVVPERLSVLCEGWKQFYHHALKGLRNLANDIESERREAERLARRGKGAPASSGRNDPCPCGSRKKYKHCCGM